MKENRAVLTAADLHKLGRITTRDEAGVHFTQIYNIDWLFHMEQNKYISIYRPLHEPTRLPYGMEEWSVEVLEPALTALAAVGVKRHEWLR